jgi:hypothetical protein
VSLLIETLIRRFSFIYTSYVLPRESFQMIAVNLDDSLYLMRIMYLFRLTRIIIPTFQQRVSQQASNVSHNVITRGFVTSVMKLHVQDRGVGVFIDVTYICRIFPPFLSRRSSLQYFYVYLCALSYVSALLPVLLFIYIIILFIYTYLFLLFTTCELTSVGCVSSFSFCLFVHSYASFALIH